MPTYASVVNFLLTAIQMLNAVIFTQIIYNKRFSIKPVILYTLVVGFISSIAVDMVSLLGVNLKLFITITASILFLKLFFRLHWIQCFISIGLYTILQAVGNILAYITFYVLNVNDILAKQNIWLLIWANVIINLVNILTFIIIRAFKVSSAFPKEIKTKAYLINTAYIVFTLLIIIVNFSFYYNFSRKDMSRPGLILNALIMLCYFIFTILNTKTLFNLESKKQELEYQIFYNKTLDSLMGDLRRFKHNYNNMLNVLGGYITANEWQDLEKYHHELIKQSTNTTGFNNVMLLNIKSAGLLGLFVSKLDYAKNEDVTVKVVVTDEIREVNMKISELCEILGIILDNAIEAAAESQKKFVNVHISNTNKITSFSVENSVKSKPNVNLIFNESYSTKGQNRGLGLWVAKKITDRYDNVLLNTSADEHVFHQELIIS